VARLGERDRCQERARKGEEKLLVRQAVWKFLVEALFDRARPFASFGSASGELASCFAFDKLFPDHGNTPINTLPTIPQWKTVA